MVVADDAEMDVMVERNPLDRVLDYYGWNREAYEMALNNPDDLKENDKFTLDSIVETLKNELTSTNPSTPVPDIKKLHFPKELSDIVHQRVDESLKAYIDGGEGFPSDLLPPYIDTKRSAYFYGRRIMNSEYIPPVEITNRHDFNASIRPVLQTMLMLVDFAKIPLTYKQIVNEAFRISGTPELMKYFHLRKGRFLQGKDIEFLPVMEMLAKVNGYHLIRTFISSKKTLLTRDYVDMMELFASNNTLRDSFLACIKVIPHIEKNNKNTDALILLIGIAKMISFKIIPNADTESLHHLYTLMKDFNEAHYPLIKKTQFKSTFGRWVMIAEWIAEALSTTKGNGFTNWLRDKNVFQWWVNGSVTF